MPDLQQTQPALNEPVVAGGVKAITLGGGLAPALVFGSGAPTITAPQGSLYLNTTGSTTATRLYVNTTGAAVWTAVTTVA